MGAAMMKPKVLRVVLPLIFLMGIRLFEIPSFETSGDMDLSSADRTSKTTTTTISSPPSTETIRSWGCGLTETPFIFVHLNKAGGGNIRRQIAKSAFNVTRNMAEKWFDPDLDSSYYPIRGDTSVRKGQFCNSARIQYMPLPQRCFEGFQICHASTPIGLALACPANYRNPHACGRSETVDPLDPSIADLVYVGHNGIGSEIHWLPVPFLKQWWQEHFMEQSGHDATQDDADWIFKQWERLDGIHPWCSHVKRPLTGQDLKTQSDCSTLRMQVDEAASRIVNAKALLQDQDNGLGSSSSTVGQALEMANFYSSLPVLRVVMMREPFSLFASRFSWYRLRQRGVVCDNVAFAAGTGVYRNNSHPLAHSVYAGLEIDHKKKSYEMDFTNKPGWARRWALDIIFQLCGADCRTRHLTQESSLSELVAQAAANLRRSFAVVGILENGEDEFFEMISQRVDYLREIVDANKSSKNDSAGRHSTSSKGEVARCKTLIKSATYQQKLIEASPEVVALVHLYKVALEVNEFQKKELKECVRVEEKL